MEPQARLSQMELAHMFTAFAHVLQEDSDLLRPVPPARRAGLCSAWLRFVFGIGVCVVRAAMRLERPVR